MAKNPKTQPESEARTKGVDLPEVERVLDFMHKHGLEEFEYERNGLRIRLKKPSASTQAAFRPVPASDIVVAAPPSPASSEGASAPPREAALEAARLEDLHVVKSPIVGTFYA